MKAHNLKYLTAFSLIMFICAWHTNARDLNTPFFFSNLGIEHGMAHGTVNVIFQDSDGFMWIGTRGGLHYYNGYEFKIFRNIPNDITSLKDNTVLSITEDNDKNIWVVTNNAIHKITWVTHNITRYSMPETGNYHAVYKTVKGDLIATGSTYLYIYDKESDKFVLQDWLSGKNNSTIFCLFEDKDNNLFLGTRKSGVFILDQEYKILKHYHPHEKIIEESIVNYYLDSHQNLWILSEREGLCKFNILRGTCDLFNMENSGLNSNHTRTILELNKDTLLLGTFSGLNLIDVHENIITPVLSDPDEPGSLSHYSIHSLYKDQMENLWVGTWKGLNMHSEYRKKIYILKNKAFNGVIGKGEEDPDGVIWFASEGAGILSYNPETGEHNIYPLIQPFKKNYQRNIIKAIKLYGDKILCSTNYGTIYEFAKHTGTYELKYDWKNNDIYDIHIDKKNSLWIPTNTTQGLIKINHHDGTRINEFPIGDDETIKFHSITIIEEPEEGIFLFGTLSQGVYYYNCNTTEYKHIHPKDFNLFDDEKLGIISGIIIDDQSNIWVSTYGNGIFVFDKNLHLLKNFDQIEGLSNNYIYTMIKDTNGIVWAITTEALFYILPNDNIVNSIILDKDLQMEFSMLAATLSKDGILYFPGNQGILSFDPSHLKKRNGQQPLYITSIYVNHQENPGFTNSIVLEANQTNIAIGYTAINYVSTAQNQYSFIMEGIDTEWTDAGERRIAYYNNLPPGKYQFRVKSYNSEINGRNSESTLFIRVKTPAYKTWWAWLIYISFFMFILYKFIYHQKVRNELENSIRFKQLEKEKINELHKERMQLFANFSHELRYYQALISL